MATVISANNIKIGGDTAGLISSLRAAGPHIRAFTTDISLKVSTAYREADNAQRVFRSGLKRLGDDITSVGQKMSLFGGLPALFAAGASYRQFADLQRLENALGQYGATLEEIKELAKLPNVSIEGAAQATIDLRSVGFSAEFSTRSIKAFANALTLAGKSSADLQPTLVNLQQMMSTGSVSAVDIKEMARRVPQVRKALQDAFGTSEGAALTKIGPQKVIEAIVSELEKLPPLAGGAGMAMEQFGDSFQFATASFGEMIEKSFSVSGIISKMGDALDNVTDHLRALSPEAQRSILAVGSLAVIIPAATTAIGGMIKVLPLLATGFGLVSAPIAATVAAVSIGVAAIITNWDKVKSAFQDSGLWTNLKGIVTTSINLIAEVVKLGLNLIQGDWENFGIALKNIGKSIWNAIVETFAGGVKTVVGILNELMYVVTKLPLNLIGIDTSRMNLDGFNGAVDKLTGKLKFDVPDATDKVTESFKGWGKSISNLINGGGDNGGGGLKGATEAIINLTKAEYELWKINLESKHLKDAQAVKAATEEYKKLAGAIAGLKLDPILSDPKSFLTPYSKVQRDEKYNFKNTTIALPKNISIDNYSALSGEDFGPASVAELMSAIPKKLAESHKEYQQRLNEWKQTSIQTGRAIGMAFQDAAGSAVEGIGVMVGNMMSGIDDVEGFGLRLGSAISGMMKGLGKSLIGFGTAGIAMKKFISNPTTALIAGAGLIALSTALNNNISQQMKSASTVKLAKGGAVYGETMALVGDNRNARFDPELVAPASHVERYIAESIKRNGGARSIRIVGELEAKGENLRLVLDRVDRKNKSLSAR